jgi:capsular polysaccharide biosynthesis protein
MPHFMRLNKICPPLYGLGSTLYQWIQRVVTRPQFDWPSFPRLRRISPTLYDIASDLKWRIQVYWHWWRSRLPGGQAFLPALRGFAFTTRSYFQHSRSSAANKVSDYIAIEDARHVTLPAPKTLGDSELATRLISVDPPLFAAQLKNAHTYGNTGDVITADGILLADISYTSPSDLWFMRRKHPIMGLDPLPEPRKLKGTFALLTTPSAGLNYFHWMFGLLPRIAILERAGIDLASIDGFLINHLHFPEVQCSMLRVVGIQPERVVEMNETDAFQPQRLWVTSHLLACGHLRRWLCQWLREKYLVSPPLGKPSRRLYISRADASNRRVANEDEMMDFLTPLGFEKVVIGHRSVFEQSALFASAETIVGPHGATFANIVFCSPRTRIIEMIPRGRYSLLIWELSACMYLDYYYAITEWISPPYPSGFGEGDTIIRLDRLASILHCAGVS